MIRGYQIPSPLNSLDPDWDPELGLRLAQKIECQKKNSQSSVKNFLYYLYYLVLHFSSDLCAAYLDYSADLTQILRALAAPIKLVASTTSHFRMPLPVACRSSRENCGAPLAPSNVGHSIPPPSHPVRLYHPASSKPVSPIILSSA